MQCKSCYYDAVLVKGTTPWANETTFRPITVKKAEREALKEKLVRLQKEWVRIRRASPDALDRIIGLSNFVKNRRKARKTR
jgi:hypothetical protein